MRILTWMINYMEALALLFGGIAFILFADIFESRLFVRRYFFIYHLALRASRHKGTQITGFDSGSALRKLVGFKLSRGNQSPECGY